MMQWIAEKIVAALDRQGVLRHSSKEVYVYGFDIASTTGEPVTFLNNIIRIVFFYQSFEVISCYGFIMISY